MKVIAIADAPIPKKGYYHNGVYMDRAYYKGNIFEVYDSTLSNDILPQPDYLIIYHDILEMNMDVDPNNFITLEEYRNKQIDSIL